MKVVYNACYGGFSLSKEGLNLYNQKRVKLDLTTLNYSRGIDRHDSLLVEVVEELGEAANGTRAKLKIDEISEEYKNCYTISEYDGTEMIICEPSKLVEHYLKYLNVQNLTDEECRKILQEMVKILSS